MPAWVKTGTKEHVGLVHDFVSAPLTKFVWQTVETYREWLATGNELTFS